MYKGFAAAYFPLKRTGDVVLSARDSDKEALVPVAKKFSSLGFKLYATDGTASQLKANGIAVTVVADVLSFLERDSISYLLSTSKTGRYPSKKSTQIRRKANMLGVTCFTSVDTANAMVDILAGGYTQATTQIIDINALVKS